MGTHTLGFHPNYTHSQHTSSLFFFLIFFKNLLKYVGVCFGSCATVCGRMPVSHTQTHTYTHLTIESVCATLNPAHTAPKHLRGDIWV
jgi:hypothetical protein